MYNNILVTLDGSELSEAALPHMETVYKGCVEKPKVTVLMVIEPYEEPYGDARIVISPEMLEQAEKEAKERASKYLDKIAARLNKVGVPVSTKLLTGKAAETIVEFIEKNDCDLLVMSTHGRSGISRWIMGSVANKVLRQVCIPIMMIRAPKCGLLFEED